MNTSGLIAWISNSDYMSKNEKASTQLTAFPLEWGDEWVRERVYKVAVSWQISEWLLSGMQWMNICISSGPTANIRIPLEWDAVNERTYKQWSHGKYRNASWVGCLQHAWDMRLIKAWPVAVVNLLSAQVGGCPEPTQVVRPLELF